MAAGFGCLAWADFDSTGTEAGAVLAPAEDSGELPFEDEVNSGELNSPPNAVLLPARKLDS